MQRVIQFWKSGIIGKLSFGLVGLVLVIIVYGIVNSDSEQVAPLKVDETPTAQRNIASLEPTATSEPASIVVTQSPVATKTSEPEMRSDGATSPEAAVIAAFQAIEDNDANSYLDVVDPEIRSNPGNYFFFNQLLTAVSEVMGLGEVGKSSGQVAFPDLATSVIQSNDVQAKVEVRGKVRSLAYATEYSFQETVPTRKVEGRWFVTSESVGAGDRQSVELDLEDVVEVIFDQESSPVEVIEEDGSRRGFYIPVTVRNNDSVDHRVSFVIGLPLKWDPVCAVVNSSSRYGSLYNGGPLQEMTEVRLDPGEEYTDTVHLCNGSRGHYGCSTIGIDYTRWLRGEGCTIWQVGSPELFGLEVDGETLVTHVQPKPTPTAPITALRDLIKIENISDMTYDYESFPKYQSWNTTIRNDDDAPHAVLVKFRWIQDTDSAKGVETFYVEHLSVEENSVQSIPVVHEFGESVTLKNGRNPEAEILQIDGRQLYTAGEALAEIEFAPQKFEFRTSEHDSTETIFLCDIAARNTGERHHRIRLIEAKIEFGYRLRGELVEEQHDRRRIGDGTVELSPGSELLRLGGFWHAIEVPPRVVEYFRTTEILIDVDGMEGWVEFTDCDASKARNQP